MNAFILTGDHSRRFKSDKALAEIRGASMLEILHSTLKPLFTNVFQVGKKPYLEIPFIQDDYKIQCPLVGLEAALNNSDSPWNFIIACDLPLMNTEIIRKLIDELNSSDNAVIPLLNDRIQPTCAFYHRSILSTIQKQIVTAEYSLHHFLELISTKYVNFSDQYENYFLNVNQIEDIKTAEQFGESLGYDS